MNKRSLVFLLTIAFIFGTFFSISNVNAASNSSMEKQIKSLKAQINSKDKQISNLKSQVKKKDKQILALKKSVSKKDKDINYYKSYSATPVKSKVAFEGNVVSGVYQIGNKSVPVLLEYKGIKYTPTDLIGDLLHYKTTFNKSKNTVFFGVQPSGSYMSDILKPYYSSNSLSINEYMQMGGQSYNKGYSMDFYWWNNDSYAINLGGKYSHITGVLGIDDRSNNDGAIVSIYGDNDLIATYELEKAGLPVNVDLDVSKIKKLEIYSKSNSIENEQINFANVIIN